MDDTLRKVSLGLRALLDQHGPDMPDCTGRIQAFGTNRYAVHDPSTSKNTERIFQLRQPFRGSSVSAVCQEAIGLQQAGRSNKFFRIPPERGTVSAAAGAQNAFIKAVKFFSILW